MSRKSAEFKMGEHGDDQSFYNAAQPTSNLEDSGPIPSTYAQLPAEAASYFEQFPTDQFVPEYTFNPQFQDGLGFPPPPNLPLPSQLLGQRSCTLSSAPSHHHQQEQQEQQAVAQWSTQELNPLIPQFADPELDRNSSGGSVLEEGAVVGESGRTCEYQNMSAIDCPRDVSDISKS
jgi:hypothetical protein